MFHLFKSVGRFRRKSLRMYKIVCDNYELVRHKGNNPPWKIIFYGTDKLSEVTLRALNTNRYCSFKIMLTGIVHFKLY